MFMLTQLIWAWYLFNNMKYIITESQKKILSEEFGDDFYEKLYERYNLKSISYDEIGDKIKSELSKNLGISKSEMGPQTQLGMKILETTAKIMDSFRNERRYIDENTWFINLLNDVENQ